jgi:antitoxin component YwqK of YwqJK toxin-antitoxin module
MGRLALMVLTVTACASTPSTTCARETTPRGVVEGCRDAHGAWTGAWRRSIGEVALEEATYDDAGALHGAYSSRYPDGTPHAVGQYVHGQREGRWVFTHENGTSWIEGAYERGLPHGAWRETDYTGVTLFEGHYAHGRLEGAWTTRRADGEIRASGSSKHGRLEGTIVVRGADGSRYELPYRDNRLHGRFTAFDEKGEVVTSSDYIDGVEQKKVQP